MTPKFFAARLALAAAFALSATFPAPASVAPRDDDDSADIGVLNSSSADTAGRGDALTFSIRVTNSGPATPDARLETAVPTGTTLVSLAAPSGWNCSAPAEGASGPVSCSTAAATVSVHTGEESGELRAEEFELVVRVDKSAAPRSYIYSSATVTTGGHDPNEENNTASTSVRVANKGRS